VNAARAEESVPGGRRHTILRASSSAPAMREASITIVLLSTQRPSRRMSVCVTIAMPSEGSARRTATLAEWNHAGHAGSGSPVSLTSGIDVTIDAPASERSASHSSASA